MVSIEVTESTLVSAETTHSLSGVPSDINSNPTQTILNGLVPQYDAFQHLTVVTRTEKCRGLAVDKKTGNIYVTDTSNNCIRVFTKDGQYLAKFGNILVPWAVRIDGDYLYVTDIGLNTMRVYSLRIRPEPSEVRVSSLKINNFNPPRGFDIFNNLIYVADEYGDRVQILTRNLRFYGTLKTRIMTRPVDVNFSKNLIFVLSSLDNPCIHIFALKGNYIRSIITRGVGKQVLQSYFFLVDHHNNVVISDCSSHNIKVFSFQGDILHTIGGCESKEGIVWRPYGIAILMNTKLMVVCSNRRSSLQIFC